MRASDDDAVCTAKFYFCVIRYGLHVIAANVVERACL